MKDRSETRRGIASTNRWIGMFLIAYLQQPFEPAARADPSWNGRYLLDSEVKLSAKRVYERTFRPKIDVIVESASAAGQHRFRIVAEGRLCVLTGAVSESDPSLVVLTPGQSCDQQQLSGPDFTASLQTTLDQGNAQFQNGQLTLSTRWTVRGEVTLRANPETPTRVQKASLSSRGAGARQQ